MGQLARERRDIIILSFPVDIWDYIGWKDTLAKPEFTARQRHYSQTRGDHQVYTPQAVVDGAAHAVGSDKQHLLALVDELEPARKALGASLRITERDGMLIADLDAGDPGAGSGDVARGAGVWLLRVVRARTIAIGRGENDGRRVTYTNVVRSMVRMGHWMGAAARFEMPLAEARGDDGEGYVVIVQKNMGEVLGPVLAAARSGNL